MLKSVLLWAIKVPTLLFLDIFTTIFSPIICLFVTKEEESEVTGFPSLHPGMPREFLIKPLRWFQSTDAPLDEWWQSSDYGKNGYLKTHFNNEYYNTHWWLRYVCRILWVCRNPAYGFGLALGYDSKNMTYIIKKDEEILWKTGVSNSSYYVVVNPKGEIGWWYKCEKFYTKNRCIMISIGYKLDADSIDGRKFVAMQFNPFKKYPK